MVSLPTRHPKESLRPADEAVWPGGSLLVPSRLSSLCSKRLWTWQEVWHDSGHPGSRRDHVRAWRMAAYRDESWYGSVFCYCYYYYYYCWWCDNVLYTIGIVVIFLYTNRGFVLFFDPLLIRFHNRYNSKLLFTDKLWDGLAQHTTCTSKACEKVSKRDWAAIQQDGAVLLQGPAG